MVAPKTKRWLTVAILLSTTVLLSDCNDAHPLYGPDSPRNGAGLPVNPVYGTSLPGSPGGFGY